MTIFFADPENQLMAQIRRTLDGQSRPLIMFSTLYGSPRDKLLHVESRVRWRGWSTEGAKRGIGAPPKKYNETTQP